MTMSQSASKTLAEVADLVAGLESRLLAHDAKLNDKQNAGEGAVSPTGDDYNALFNEVIDLAKAVRVLVDNSN
jgi:hypothetical protein